MSEPTPEEELMIRDQLDDLLDASAPASHAIDQQDVRVMATAARAEASKPRSRRRAVALSGGLVLVLLGGAGMATATSDWRWGEGLETSTWP